MFSLNLFVIVLNFTAPNNTQFRICCFRGDFFNDEMGGRSGRRPRNVVRLKSKIPHDVRSAVSITRLSSSFPSIKLISQWTLAKLSTSRSSLHEIQLLCSSVPDSSPSSLSAPLHQEQEKFYFGVYQ